MNNILSESPSSFPSNGRAVSKASRRQSLNIVSPTASSGPRQLHLALGSVVANLPSPTKSGSPSRSPGPSSSTGAPSAIPNDGSQKENTTHKVVSPIITGSRKHPTRRQSSIPYISSNSNGHHSPSQQQFTGDGSVLVHSPLSSTFSGDSLKTGGGLVRGHSFGGRAGKSPRSLTIADRFSTGSMFNQDAYIVAQHLKERPPTTLAEKHAELLHFIAQKESKCLELRSQLAMHEAELLQLKRKWERIVNRGFEKSLSPSSAPNSASPSPRPLSASFLSSPSPNSPFPPTSSYSPVSPGSASASSMNFSSSATYFPTVTPTSTTPGVYEGIKGGVQGVSRFIAAGLESIVNVTPATTQNTCHAHAPIPLRLGSTAGSRPGSVYGAHHGHVQKESQSSSSTTTSATTSSTRFSLLSTSSATSAASVDATPGTRNGADADVDLDSEFGDFEDGHDNPRTRFSLETNEDGEQEQVLMVHDTGATPTMSPNPAFRRKKELMDAEVEVEGMVLPSPRSRKEKDKLSDPEDFNWEDRWDEPTSANEVFAPASFSPANQDLRPQAQHQVQTTIVSPHFNSKPKSSAPSLPPFSSIPGLATTMGMAVNGGPSAQQMSSWVGSVGKKWGELGSTTFTKNQKRASLLISDMQQSIVSALTSPSAGTSTNTPTSSTYTPSIQTPTTTSSLSSPFSPSASHDISHTHTKSQPMQRQNARGMGHTSLLDESDDEGGHSLASAVPSAVPDGALHLGSRLSVTVPVMVPDSLASNSALSATPASAAPPKSVLKPAKVPRKPGKVRPLTGGSVSSAGRGGSARDKEDEWNW